MEKKEITEVTDIWKKNANDLKIPKIVLAIDRTGCKYFVIKDESSIVFMVKNGTNSTFAIPAKYCIKKRGDDFYTVNEIDKLAVVSCTKKNKYEIFVQKYLLK